jgi:hypothetical protein
MSRPPSWEEMRLAALVLLAAYLVFALALFPREAQFLRGLETARQRGHFIAQDLLLQLSVLALLLPLGLSRYPSRMLFATAFSAFGALWVVVLWVGASRYAYTWRLLNPRQGAGAVPQHKEKRNEPWGAGAVPQHKEKRNEP